MTLRNTAMASSPPLSTKSTSTGAFSISNPIIDRNLLKDLESRALEVSTSLDALLNHLQSQLREYSSSTLESISTYKLTTENLSATVNQCTKKTLELITQCDELDKDFAPLYTLAAQIKSINKTLDIMQQALR